MKYLSILFSLGLFLACSSTDGLALGGATTDVRIGGNLDATAYGTAISGVPGRLPAFTTFDSLYAASDFQVPVTVFDSLAGSHPINLFFFRDNTASVTAKVATTWVVRAYVDDSELQNGTESTQGLPIQVGADTTMTFGPDGKSVFPVNGSVVINNARPAEGRRWRNGSPSEDIDFTLYFSTRYDPNKLPNQSLSKTDFLDVQPKSCVVSEAKLLAHLDLTDRFYPTEWGACSMSPDSFAVSADQLAERAVTEKKCATRKYLSEASCRRCFDGAAALIRKGYDKRLFRGLLFEANRSIERRKVILCSRKALQT